MRVFRGTLGSLRDELARGCGGEEGGCMEVWGPMGVGFLRTKKGVMRAKTNTKKKSISKKSVVELRS
jgi:hypothetical protein